MVREGPVAVTAGPFACLERVLVYACAKHIGMVRMSDQICLFQVIMAEHKSEPLRVLEEQILPAAQCSLEVAKVEFMQRFEDKSYSRKHRVLWPDAVRFLDQGGNEAVRYTAWNYLREMTTKERDSAS